jgi:hypothetical protein
MNIHIYIYICDILYPKLYLGWDVELGIVTSSASPAVSMVKHGETTKQQGENTTRA